MGPLPERANWAAGGALAPTAEGAPVNQGAPSITGLAVVGQRLVEAHGLWANNPTSYSYQWLRCHTDGSGCTVISGAASSSYVVGVSDVGFAIVVQESAANAFGTSTPVASSATSVVPPLGLSVTVATSGPTMTAIITCPGHDGQLCVGQLTLRTQERIRGRTIVAVSARQRERVTTVALGHTSFAVPAPGQRRLSMTIDAAGRRLLRDFYKVPARLTFPGTALAARTVIFDYPVIGDVITYTASWRRRYTIMRRFIATELPPQARVQLRCRGPGCPFHQHTSHSNGADLDLSHLFGDAHLLPTATLFAAVTAPNMVGKLLLMRIRAGAPPRVTTLCLVPGVNTPRPCRRADSAI